SDIMASRWLGFGVLSLGTLMIVLDTTIVNVALPSVKADLGFSDTGLAWVVNAYVLTFGGLLLLGGRLGDLYGPRRLFLGGIALFTLASLACGTATTQAFLVAARAVQGVGGAVVSAVSLSLIMGLFPAPEGRAKAMGFYGFVAAGGRQPGRPPGRPPHARAELALGLPRQPAHRDRRRHLRPRGPPRHARPDGREAPRRRGRRHRHGRPRARRVRGRQRRRLRLGLAAHAGPPRRRGRAAGGVPPRGDARARPAGAAGPLPPAQPRDGQRHRRPLGRRHVRVVLPRRALHAARPGVRSPPGGAGLPRVQRHHGRLLPGPLREDRAALRHPAAPRRGARPRRHGAPPL